MIFLKVDLRINVFLFIFRNNIELSTMPIDRKKALQSAWHPCVRDSLILLFMAALAFAVYLPSINGPFLFDDKTNILYSLAVRMTEFSLPALQKVIADGFLASRPVANISFALNYLIHQYSVMGYHVVNILLHVATAFLLYLLFQVTLLLISRSAGKKTPTILLPLTAALIWLVHPLQSQSVAYIVQRMNSLAAMFYLLTMLLYVYGRLAGCRRNRVVFFSGSLLTALLAVGSKEMAATLPCFIFLYEWYFFQDLSGEWLKKRLPYLAIVIVAFMVLALFFLDGNPFGYILSSYRIRDFTLGQRVLTELRVVVFYLGQLLWPHPSRLSLEHDISLSYSLFAPMTTIFAAFFLAAMAGAASWLARRERLLSFAILWYLGNMLVESSVIGLELIFEHRNYLPSMFLVLLIVTLFDRFFRQNWAKMAIACLVMLLFSLWTYERSTVWADEETLRRDCVAKAPAKYRARANLGNTLYSKGKYNAAITVYYQALQIYAEDPAAYRRRSIFSVHTNLGNALSSIGRYVEATDIYYQGLRFYPGDAKAYLGLGHTTFLQGKYDAAIFNYRKALLLANKDPAVVSESRRGLGLALDAKKQQSPRL